MPRPGRTPTAEEDPGVEPSTPRTPTGERFTGATVGRHGAASISEGSAVDGSIPAAGPRAGFLVPPDVEVIDLRGSTVLRA
jgi:hypothetical protein